MTTSDARTLDDTDPSTGSSHPHGHHHGRLGGLISVAHRWPVLVGVGLGLLAADGLDDGVPFGTILAWAALGYLLVALLGRLALTWPLMLALGAVIVGLRVVGVDAVPVFAVAAAVLAVVALATGRLRESALRLLLAPAAWLFGGAALVATLVSVEVGSLVVAVGLLLHTVWDVVLWRAERSVVSRSWVEYCAVFDAVVGIAIIVWLVR